MRQIELRHEGPGKDSIDGTQSEDWVMVLVDGEPMRKFPTEEEAQAYAKTLEGKKEGKQRVRKKAKASFNLNTSDVTTDMIKAGLEIIPLYEKGFIDEATLVTVVYKAMDSSR